MKLSDLPTVTRVASDRAALAEQLGKLANGQHMVDMRIGPVEATGERLSVPDPDLMKAAHNAVLAELTRRLNVVDEELQSLGVNPDLGIAT